MKLSEEPMTEPTPEEYTQAVYDLVNYGLSPKTVHEARAILDMHMDLMSQEKSLGKPRGPIVWDGYMAIMHMLIRRVDVLEAQESVPEGFLWVNTVTK